MIVSVAGGYAGERSGTLIGYARCSTDKLHLATRRGA